MTGITTRTVDHKGRVTLGKEFADHLVIIKQLSDGLLQVVKAEAVPAKEAWLHKNKEAFEAVMEGIEQAKSGEFVEGPDLEGDSALADSLPD